MLIPAKKENLCFPRASESYHMSNNITSARHQGHPFAEGWENHCFHSPHGLQVSLPPCSPSESENSSSAFSTIGSSSSSSSFFNDTCSYGGIGELSPASVGSTEAKSAMLSPVRVGLQEMHLANACSCTGKWEATAIRRTTPIQPVRSSAVSGVSDDGFFEFKFVKGKMTEKEMVQVRKNVKSTCGGSPCTHSDAGQGRASQEIARYPGDNHATACLSAAASQLSLSSSGSTHETGQLQDARFKPECRVYAKQGKGYELITEYANSCIQVDASSYSMEHAPSLETEQTSTDRGDDERGQVCRDHPSEPYVKPPKRAFSRASDRICKRPSFITDSCLEVSVDAHEYLKSVLEHGSSPFDTDIGIDIASLKHLPASMTPCKEVSLSRALSLHQSPRGLGRPPLIPTPKLNNTPYSAKALNLGMLERRIFSSSRMESPTQIKQRRASDVSDVSPCGIQDLRKIIAIIHSNQESSKLSKESYVSTVRNSFSCNGLKGNLSRESPLFPAVDGKHAHKALCLASPHIEEKCKGASAEDSTVAFSFKARKDWRSRSVGRASLKSTVRNLEAAFSGHGSVSHVKPSSLIPEGPETSQNFNKMDMICVGSAENRPKQNPSLSSPMRPLSRAGQCVGNLPSRMKGNAMPSSLGGNGIVRRPKKLIKMPLSPISHKPGRANFELLCKPLISVSRSLYQLPASNDALGVEITCPSGHTLHRSSSRAPVAAITMLQASVQCIVRDGLTCYTMTIEGSEEVIIAKDCLARSDSQRLGAKWLCTFHLGKRSGRVGGWRRWIKRESKRASAFIGVMKVSSRSASDSRFNGVEGTHSVVSEFVLYDGKAQAAVHSQSLRATSLIVPPQRRCLYGLATESASSSYEASSEHVKLSNHSYSELSEKEATILSMIQSTSSVSSVQMPTPRRVTGVHRSSCSVDSWSDSDFLDWESQVLDPSLLSHMELAAISINLPGKIHHNEVSVLHEAGSGGWGLKFLSGGSISDINGRVSHISHSLSLSGEHIKEVTSRTRCKDWNYARMMCSPNSSASPDCLQAIGDSGGMENRQAGCLDMEVSTGTVSEKRVVCYVSEPSESLTLILPSGDHGLPDGKESGPSSLLERWQSGGSCECGGWDLGCGIDVFSSGISKGHAMTSVTNNMSSLSHGQPINIFSQGRKQELMLKLAPVKQGLFQLSFQGKISSLKAFATAVAILYSYQASLSSLPMPDREA